MLVDWRYRPRDTWVHRLDPRVKILLLIIPVLIGAIINDIRLMVVLVVISAFYYRSARIPWRDIRRIWIYFSVFVLAIVSVNALLFNGGTQVGITSRVILSWPWLGLQFQPPFVHAATYHLTGGVLVFVLTQILRLYSMAMFAFSFPFVVDPVDYGVAFNGLGVPYKFAFAIDMAFRYVPSLGRDMQMTIDAQRVRGYELDRVRGGPIRKAINLAPIVVPVVLNSILGAEDIIDAMDLRGFGVGKRTWLRRLAYQDLDRIVIAVMIVALAATIVAGFTGHIGTWLPPSWR